MVWYEKKKDILGRLGKGEKDVRYLERMIKMWKVVKRGGEYCLREEVEGKISMEKEEYERLQKVEEEIEKWRESNQAYKGVIQEKDEEIERLNKELENNEDRVNAEYWENKFRDCEKELNDYKFRKKGAVWSWIRKRFRIGEDQYDAFSEEREKNV